MLTLGFSFPALTCKRDEEEEYDFGPWFLLSEPWFPHLQNAGGGVRGSRMIVGEGRAELSLVHKAPSSYVGPPSTHSRAHPHGVLDSATSYSSSTFIQ